MSAIRWMCQEVSPKNYWLMDNKERVYIVSFADSRKYLYTFDDNKEEYALEHDNPLQKIEDEIRDYLEKQFPEVSLAYYYTPKVVEVEASHEDRYKAYPPLDAKAIEDIKELLVREVRDRISIEQLNNNAPYADAPV